MVKRGSSLFQFNSLMMFYIDRNSGNQTLIISIEMNMNAMQLWLKKTTPLIRAAVSFSILCGIQCLMLNVYGVVQKQTAIHKDIDRHTRDLSFGKQQSKLCMQAHLVCVWCTVYTVHACVVHYFGFHEKCEWNDCYDSWSHCQMR